LRKVLTIFFLALNTVLFATNYYVKNTGNDSNTGLSDAQAWAHHPWMSTWTGTVTLAPGDIVSMKRSDTWSISYPSGAYMIVGQSGSAGKPITTTAYGTGDSKPIIHIDTNTNYAVIEGFGKSYITFDNLDISHYAATRSYPSQKNGIRFGKDESLNVPHDWIIKNCTIHDIPTEAIRSIDDSYNITVGDVTATTTATATAFSNHIYNCGYGGIVLCGRNPITNRSNFKVFYNYVHDIDKSAVSVEDAYGIGFTSLPLGSGVGYSDGWPVNSWARFNCIKNISCWEGIDTHGASYIYIQDNYIYNCHHGIITFAAVKAGYDHATLDHAYIERNTIEMPASPLLASAVSIILLSDDDNNKVSNSAIRDNICFYTTQPEGNRSADIGILVYSVDSLIIEGNSIYNGVITASGGAISLGSTNQNLSDIIIRNNWVKNWYYGINLRTDAIKGNLAIHNNIIIATEKAICGVAGEFANNFALYNNTLLAIGATPTSSVLDFSGDVTISNGASLTIKNNIIGFISAATTGKYIHTPGKNNGTLNIDYNLYWNSKKADPYYLQNVSHTWSDWNTHGYDIHSINDTNPLFVNHSGSYLHDLDFNIQSASPAVNTGTDVGLATDYIGASISGLPDIGAFEAQLSFYIPLPVYLSATVENVNPAILEMNFSLSLANIVPMASDFTVLINSTACTLSSVAISGEKVLLTLAIPVAYGDVVTVAYAKPSTNPLQTTEGGQAASISAQRVTNMVAAPTVPVYVNSAIESTTPSTIELTYNLSLANIIPATSAFNVRVNSVARTASSVSVSGTKVLLTLSNPVVYGNIITVDYTKPSVNPLQTPAGGQAATLSAQNVTNNVTMVNSPPVIVVNYPASSYSGFVNEINAGDSYDPNNDKLSFTWLIPDNISVSSTIGSKIKFLSPIVIASQIFEFTLQISDEKTIQSKVIPIEIIPYKPELEVAEISNVDASSFQTPNFPKNILDGNIGTMWAVIGDNQWLIMGLKESFNIQHVKIAFHPGEQRESYFDILGSEDRLTWELILTKSSSCGFSGDFQVFDFPPTKTEKEFRYVKLVGHSNSGNSWNYISEFKIFGYKHKNPTNFDEQPIHLYPNPANQLVNIRIDDSTLKPDFIRIINLAGKIVFQDKVNPDIKELQIPINLVEGAYIVQMGSGKLTQFTQKLIIGK
jgi:uncharacterized repeat protein (TIGR02059 family)